MSRLIMQSCHNICCQFVFAVGEYDEGYHLSCPVCGSDDVVSTEEMIEGTIIPHVRKDCY